MAKEDRTFSVTRANHDHLPTGTYHPGLVGSFLKGRVII